MTPATSAEILTGKLIPLLFIGYLEVFLVVGAGRIFFHTPFWGSFSFLLIITFPFILTTLSRGLFASAISRTQQQAMTTSYMIMMPNILLSGFIFPIESMPVLLQKLTVIIPLKYYMTIVRSIFLKGAGISILWKEFLTLFGFGIFFFLLSIRSFRKRLV